MKKYIVEKERKTTLNDKYDVVVCGGGIAGVSSALASARRCAKTLLLERSFMVGGLATSGIITVYLPLCDGNGRQVSFGIVEELIRLSVKHGYEPCYYYSNARYNPEWFEGGNDVEKKKEKRFLIQFNANVFAILMEQLLLENGVDILYGTNLVSCEVDNDKITSVIVENKSGRSAYSAKNFIDTTGDADLCDMAGEETELFKQGNVVSGWFYYTSPKGYILRQLGACDIPDEFKTEEEKQDKGFRFLGLDAEELSRITFMSHSASLKEFLKEGGITKDHALTSISSIPQVRMTRKIVGEYSLDVNDEFKHFDDSIGMISNWRSRGPVFEVPFRTLYGRKIKNLYTAGRSISVTESMWDLSRVIPACAVTGQAVGTAAAMFEDLNSISISALQEALVEDGVKLHVTDLEPIK